VGPRRARNSHALARRTRISWRPHIATANSLGVSLNRSDIGTSALEHRFHDSMSIFWPYWFKWMRHGHMKLWSRIKIRYFLVACSRIEW
jgi:hypothetical protein